MPKKQLTKVCTCPAALLVETAISLLPEQTGARELARYADPCQGLGCFAGLLRGLGANLCPSEEGFGDVPVTHPDPGSRTPAGAWRRP